MPSNICVAVVLGHTDVLKAMLSALGPGTMVTSNDMSTRSGGAQELQLGVLKLERMVKHVLNARTSGGRTPLLLACENGCALGHLQAIWNLHPGSAGCWSGSRRGFFDLQKLELSSI